MEKLEQEIKKIEGINADLKDADFKEHITNEEIEKEVNEIIKNDLNKMKFDKNLVIDLDEYDEIFQMKNDDLPNVTVDDREIRQMFSEYEKQIDREIEKEMLETYKPSLFDGDEERANKLLQEDELIRAAVDRKMISKEEVIMFVDYYTIFSLINKCNKYTLEELNKIEELTKKPEDDEDEEEYEEGEEYEDEEEEEEEEEEEPKKDDKKDDKKDNKKDEEEDVDNYYDEVKDDAIGKLMSEIEKKINVSESILSRRFDVDKLNFHKGEFITEVPNKGEGENGKEPGANENEPKVSKDTQNSNTSPAETSTTTEQKPTEKNKLLKIAHDDLMKVPRFLNGKTIGINPKPKIKSLSKAKPKVNTGLNEIKKPLKPPKSTRFELFNDNGEPVNLIKMRNDRREIIRLRLTKQKMRNKKGITREENQKLRENFEKLFDLKSTFTPSTQLDKDKKSLLRRRLEDAQNFTKENKKMN